MFVHLHAHLTGSYSDSALKPEDAAVKAAADGQPALALTDHGELAVPYTFQTACRARGIKPIYGVELYFVENAAESIERKKTDRYHLVALAKNRNGLRTLNRLVSDAWLENCYQERRGLVDWKLLEKHHEDIILLSACYYNIVAQHATRRGIPRGVAAAARFRDIFGDDFYLEIGRHFIPEEDKVNANIIAVAQQLGMTPVLTNDAHYLDEADWLTHDVIIKTRFDKATEYTASSRAFWMKTEAEMRALGFPEDYLAASCRVAEKCEDFSLDETPPQPAPRVKLAEIDRLIASGHAAYVADMTVIDHDTAVRHVADTFKDKASQHQDIVGKITGIPRRSEPDNDHVAIVRDRPIKDVIALKRCMGKIMTQWDADACRRAGADIVSTQPSTFAEKLKALFSRP